MKTALIEVQDKFKSTLRFYEVKDLTTVVIDPCQVFDDSGYAVFHKPIGEAVLHVVKDLKVSYMDGLTNPQDKAEAMKYIGDFYRIVI